MKTEKQINHCKYCGKEIPIYKYFCDIKCEVAYTDQLNIQQAKEVK